jgi:rubrerythrin
MTWMCGLCKTPLADPWADHLCPHCRKKHNENVREDERKRRGQK